MEQIAKRTSDLISKTKYLTRYTMNIDEMCKLYQMCRDSKDIEAICMAFYFGFALGTRAKEKGHVSVL